MSTTRLYKGCTHHPPAIYSEVYRSSPKKWHVPRS